MGYNDQSLLKSVPQSNEKLMKFLFVICIQIS